MSRRAKKKPPDSRRYDEKMTRAAVAARKVGQEPPRPGGREGAADWSSLGPKDWLLAAALVATVFLVYQPAWQGGFVWDDDAHVTRSELCSWQGLYRIWFAMGATAQYYPLLHSAFWLEHKLWGDTTLGYHLVNILLHATAALMVALVLRRLAVPGVFLAATIFALHPVQTESVAWITEQKNTLSAVFYLGAMLVYLRFDQTRKTSLYCWALALFLLAILSKTVTATLPGALLVVFWWQRGRLSWKKDILPLVPFFVLGTGGGMITAWWELKINNCIGPEFQFTLVERLLIAGRAIWFHLWKLCWPTKLTFIYPRWQIDSATWWQYLFPLGVMGLVAGCWSIRRRTRAPLAALLFFGGTLFPTLGFFNLYTFRYSLVANHYQYLASLGPLTLAAAGAALLFARWHPWPRRAGDALCLVLLATLAGLTWRQSQMYGDTETLYGKTIVENPDCWLAHYNLGVALARRGWVDAAIAHYQQALKSKPDFAEAHYNFGVALARRGRVDDAVAHFQQAVTIKPDFAEAHDHLGVALVRRGQVDDAIAHYQQALEIKPDYALAHDNLGVALAGRGQVDEAVTHYQKALEIKPDYALAHNNLGVVLVRRGQVDAAIAHYEQALKVKPDFADAHYNLGVALAQRGEVDAAIGHFQKVLAIKPDDAEAHYQLGVGLASRCRFAAAMFHYRKDLEIRPEHAEAHNNLAWLLATCPAGALRNGAEAIEHAQRAIQFLGDARPDILDTLAAAYAEARRFPEAVASAHKALELAREQNKPAVADILRARITLYETGKPLRNSPTSHGPALTRP
jgi:tetratricopeptide (TPR) repeat protein